MIHLKLSVHVQARFYERNIDIDHVKRAIESPDDKKEDNQATKVRKRVGEKTITVLYSGEMSPQNNYTEYLIITAYYVNN
jgi:hypothetical protein